MNWKLYDDCVPLGKEALWSSHTFLKTAGDIEFIPGLMCENEHYTFPYTSHQIYYVVWNKKWCAWDQSYALSRQRVILQIHDFRSQPLSIHIPP